MKTTKAMRASAARLGSEVIAGLKPTPGRLSAAVERAFAKLDAEVIAALAHDPKARGIVRRAIWEAREAVAMHDGKPLDPF